MRQNGIHHVTAIAGPAQRNLDFYTRTLGLRLVKKTVNFDDPGTYHFYYGDEAGQPGTILTFFPWEHAAPGRLGIGETQETVFRVPEGAIGYWTHRLVEKGVPHEAPREALRRDGAGVQGSRRHAAGPGGRRPASRPSRPGAPARSRPSMRSAASTASACCCDEAAPTGAILTDVFGFTEVGPRGLA